MLHTHKYFQRADLHKKDARRVHPRERQAETPGQPRPAEWPTGRVEKTPSAADPRRAARLSQHW